MASYLFGGDTGETAESIARRREIAKALLEGSMYAAPQNVGEGLTAIGAAIGGRLAERRADKAEGAARSEAMSSFQKNLPFWLQSSMGGASAPSAPPSSPSQPTRSSSPSMTPQQAPKSKEEFISMMMPAALQASERTGVDPRLIIAQAAQETGWGKSAPGNNYFGIKSHGQGGGQNLATHEYVDGKRVNVNANFRQYGGPTESALGYADFLLSNPRYQPMLNAEGLDAQLAALGQSGYATDPNYAQSVGSIARSIPLPPEMAGNQGQDAISAVTAYQPGMVNDPAALGPARYAPGMTPQPSAPPAPAPPQQPAFNPLMQRRDQLAQQTGSQQIAQADPNKGFLAAVLGGGQGGQPSGGEFPPAPSPDGMDAMRGPQLPFDPAMLELANNPFLPEGQRAVLQTMIQQQMQAADPMRRLEMQRAQLELEQLRNPRPDPTDDMREYQYAVSQGYQGSFQDFMTENRRAGATTVNVGGGPDLGKLSTDYGYVLDPNTREPVIDPATGLPRAAPVPGSPAAREIEQAQRARQNAQNQTGMYSNIVLEDIGRARDLIENSPWYSPTTGAIGNILKDIGGTNAADVQELTKVVKANIGFDRLQAMREASPTGGALGQVTERELNFLQSTLGSLEQVQSEEQLLQNLDRLNVIYTNIMEKAAAYPNAGEFGFTALPEGGEGERPADVPQELWDVMTPEERALWQ